MFSLKEKQVENVDHSHRGEDVVGEGKPPVNELLLVIVEGVAIVNVELTLCSSLSDRRS